MMKEYVDRVIEKLKDYRIPIPIRLTTKFFELERSEIEFIDREYEVERLFKNVFSNVLSWNFVIYGPWGCGKTEFARALTYTLNQFDDFQVIYVNLAEEEYSRIFVHVKKDVKQYLISLIETSFGEVGKLVLNLYMLFQNLIEKIKLQDKHLIFIIDEITRSLNRYKISIRDFISSMDKKVHEVRNLINSRTFYTIILTSEQTAVNYFIRESGKSLNVYMMWHLPKNDFEKLLEELNCPLDFDEVWKISGGCPRVAIELAYLNWNVETWLNRVRTNIRSIIDELYAEGINVLEILKNTNLKPDEIARTKLLNKFLEKNLLIFLPSREFIISKFVSNNEEWIGNSWAWQLPVYMKIFEEFIR